MGLFMLAHSSGCCKDSRVGNARTPAKRMLVEGYNALVQGKINLGNCDFVMALFGLHLTQEGDFVLFQVQVINL
jgi:hypothetical protein